MCGTCRILKQQHVVNDIKLYSRWTCSSLCLADSVFILSVFLRLSRDLSIQMVTALVLQLIQCSVKIPEKADEIQEADDTEDGGDESKPHVSTVNTILSVPVHKKRVQE